MNKTEQVTGESKLDSKNNLIEIDATERARLEKMYQINHDVPNLSGVKSKINTGLKKTTSQVGKEKPNEELNKKYAQVQKENDVKLKDYRDMVLKMKQDKRSQKPNEVKSFLNKIYIF